MSEIEKLIKQTLIQNFFEGFKCDDSRAAKAIAAALIAAGALKIPETAK